MKASDIMSRKVSTVDDDSQLSTVIGQMTKANIHTLPVVRNGRYVGMVSYREILKRRSLTPRSKVINYTIHTPGLSEDMDIKDVVRLLEDSGLHALPVIRDERVVGIISRTDIIRNFDRIMDTKSLRCSSVMTSHPIALSEGEVITQTLDKFRSLDVSSLPVTDEKGMLKGILKFSDISAHFVEDKERIGYGQRISSKEPSAVRVSSVMSPPIWVYDDDGLSKAVETMIREGMHVVPVTDRNRTLKGVIENVDLISLVSERTAEEGLLVNVSGLNSEDEALYDAAFYLSDKFAKKFYRITGHDSGTLNIHVIKYTREGEIKYSIRTRLISGRIIMTVDSSGWNFGKCLSDIFDIYEKRLKKELEKD